MSAFGDKNFSKLHEFAQDLQVLIELAALLDSALACWQVSLEAWSQGFGEQHPSDLTVKIIFLWTEKQGDEHCPVLTSLDTFGIVVLQLSIGFSVR